MCAPSLCLVLDYDHEADVSSLELDGREVLDPAQGIYSWLDTTSGTVTSLDLATDPKVTVTGHTVTAAFTTSLATETWTFTVQTTGINFQLSRTYQEAATLTQQGTPLMNFAADAFDNVRWAGDGGDWPIGGSLVDTYQPSWLASGKEFDPGIRAAQEQTSYTLLDASTHSALTVAGTTNHATATNGQATEMWRVAEAAGDDLRVAVETSATGFAYSGANPLGYGDDTTQNGSPVFKPVAVAAGQQDVVSLDFRSSDYNSYYALGTLRGVDQTSLSHAINDYARWMMQDDTLGASTETPQLQSEVPPFEMQWLGELLQLFPDPGAIRSYMKGLDAIKEYEQLPGGQVACCEPLDLDSQYAAYEDQSSGYALGVIEAYQLSGNKAWLATMASSVESGLTWTIDNQTDPTSRLVLNHDPTLGPADYDNNYWESSTGTYDGYTSALLYQALTEWASLEKGELQDPTGASYFEGVAATLKASFNKDLSDGGLWSPTTHTFLYGSGNQDVLYLPVNAEVLQSGIATPQRQREIAEAIQSQADEGNYDLYPMNVGDLFTAGTVAPPAGKGGEDGGWYGAPDGDFYAGLPLLGDPQLLQTDTASFLARYQADGFYGASTWNRDNPLQSTGSALWFPTTVLPAWGLYYYGYGFQPGASRLVLAPFISQAMVGSAVAYTWRGVPMTVQYRSQDAFTVDVQDPLPTALTVEWINQRPGRLVHIQVDGQNETVAVDAAGTASATLPAGSRGTLSATCMDCVTPGEASSTGTTGAVTAYSAGDAGVEKDTYGQFGAQLAIGPHPLTVTDLGRYKLAGNHLVHRVALLDANGHVVAQTTVDMADSADSDGFVEAPLSHPVTIQPGIYYLESVETPGGDTWYGSSGESSTSSDVTILAAASGQVPTTTGGAGNSYGPVTLRYRTAGPPKPWIQEYLSPSDTSVPSGGTLTIDATIWGQAPKPISGTLTTTLPTGWTASSPTFTIPTNGKPASTTVPVTVHLPDDAATASYTVGVQATASSGLQSPQSSTVTVSNTLYSFDDGTTQGWEGGNGITGLSAVTSMANGPGVPQAGTDLLQVGLGTVGPNDPRTIYVQPATPLNLSNATDLYAYVDSYGIPPYTQTHQVTITLYSGSSSISSTSSFSANVWNRVSIGVSSWSGRSDITRIAVTYTLNVPAGASYSVDADLDSVGYDA